MSGFVLEEVSWGKGVGNCPFQLLLEKLKFLFDTTTSSNVAKRI